ncbi:nucleic acid binding protein [Zea mays]|uniref:Nucleic acid binding protein n=1 Tax=Zea mays TaxID=4577 RepID=B6T2N7_MAIZE|nr:nucleic acid binding protein [Zea mays]ACG31370.1 nucleic acid binding protein [Zea mays]ONM14273.1 Nucleic acid binding protein [Zea mays]|eukprot:NP_001148410.1 nucleic acid binding protein [Zea mays]
MAAKSGYTRRLPLTGETAPPPPSAVLYVANCGPAVGVTDADVRSTFGAFGEVAGVQAADDSGARIIVRFHEPAAAEAAMAALHGRPCDLLAGRVLHIRYSVPVKPKARPGGSVPVAHAASELGIPGIYMVQEFVTAAEEQELLSAVDSKTWKRLAKRRVQHYGYEFLYETRNVDSKQFLGELPTFVSTVLEKIASFPGVKDCATRLVDQLTVNEYPCGVGLSPHIDTHSAFEEMIFSLSLAGTCIMEFRKYTKGTWRAPSVVDGVDEDSSQEPECIRKAIFLPPRSMLLMSGEGRYAWHHYIPHHKIDAVGGQVIKRNSRRVSFTFRKVRMGPCDCEYKQFCDAHSKRC